MGNFFHQLLCLLLRSMLIIKNIILRDLLVLVMSVGDDILFFLFIFYSFGFLLADSVLERLCGRMVGAHSKLKKKNYIVPIKASH